MTSMRLTVEDAFESTHHLPNYPGRCAAPHGHRWVVKIEIEPRSLKPVEVLRGGMLVDFHRVQDVVKMYDHCDLNGIIKMPTAELLSIDILERLKLLMSKRGTTTRISVELWESPGNSIRVEGYVYGDDQPST